MMFPLGYMPFPCLQLMKFLYCGCGLICRHLICRYMRIYVQALSKDYVAALSSVGSNIQGIADLVNRALLKRLSGDLQGAFDDFRAAFRSGYFEKFDQNRVECLEYHEDCQWLESDRHHLTYAVFHNGDYHVYLRGDKKGALTASKFAQKFQIIREGPLFSDGRYMPRDYILLDM